MKNPGDAAKHRQWSWCRRQNGFSDMPLWRAIAARLHMPAFQIIAFVNRLEEFANGGDERGFVGHFDPAEFGEALGMAEEDAARIFAALGDGRTPWVDGEHVANFFSRNPDTEDTTFVERKRRSRARTDVLKRLAELAQRGRIDPLRRNAIEATLRTISDAELFALQTQLAREQLSTAPIGHNVTKSDIVTVTIEQSRQTSGRAVDNFGGGASGAVAGLSEGTASGTPSDAGEAELWLATEGTKLVGEHLLDHAGAARKILRWRDHELEGDAVALVGIIRGAERGGMYGATFLNHVVQGIRNVQRQKTAQGVLPLPRVIDGGER